MITVLLLLAISNQDWSPPSRAMPDMPAVVSLPDGWRTSLGPWFARVENLENVQAIADVRRGQRPSRIRFMGSAGPAAIWSDRNGDGRADMIEIYRGGALAHQLIDRDYDGGADVKRDFDDCGSLAGEQPY
jgi:hypothetical protein